MSAISSLNDEQASAIACREQNILVSAPAGSGKTKILVTRILERLKEGISISQFLVLTFTEAAAKEMKQRLTGMLEEEIARSDGKLQAHLMRQKQELPFAYITNFHGFCNQLIARYGYLVGVENGYEILSDPGQLLQTALEQVLDDALTDEAFKTFRTLYFPKREDLSKQLLTLYGVFQSLGDKAAFLKHMEEDVYGFLRFQNHQTWDQWCFYPRLQELLVDVVEETLAGLESLKAYCAKHGITPFYDRPIKQSAKALEKPTPYEAMKNYYRELLQCLAPGVPFQKLHVWAIQKPEASYQIPWRDLDDEAVACKKEFSTLKTALNTKFRQAYHALVDTDVQNTMRIHQTVYEALTMLIELTERLENQYRLLKKQDHVLDFNDLERYATMLLDPTLPVAESLHDQLKEIMVDEYQDTNMVQERLVSLIAKVKSPAVSRFMVGDMKQSIYRFRQADPEIFKAKYDAFPNDPHSRRIDLGYNYRSSKVVLDSINFIFNQIMDTHVGSLEYYHDPSAQLNYDFLRKEGAKDTAEYEIVKTEARKRMKSALDDYTEILMVDQDSEKVSELEDSEYEAYMIGKRIQALVAHGLDGKPISYSDIAVLMRQTTHFMIYKKVFDKLAIPTTIVLSRGWQQATEIRQMLMVYRALADDHDDMALYNVLRAPFDFSYFSDETIARWALSGQSLYTCLKDIPDFQNFFAVMDELKQAFWQMPFARWHTLFFKKSGYLKRVYAMRNGMQRYQNLLLLVEKIRAQEKDIHELSEWVNYFDHLGQSEDMPAMMPKDQEAVVFMTIHKSKGLEFPIVFVAMHDKGFNLQDGKQRLIFDRHLSFAMKPRIAKDIAGTLQNQPVTYRDVVIEYENPFLALLSRLNQKESVSEEMRIYYVALTRAKNKLILTGTMNHRQYERYLKAVEVNGDQWLLDRNTRHANCYLDWLMPSVLRHPDLMTAEHLEISGLPELDNTCDARFAFHWYSHEEIMRDIQTVKQLDQSMVNLPYFDPTTYAYLDEVDKADSQAVTALTQHEIQSSQISPKTELDAATIGTLVHELMRWVPLDGQTTMAEIMADLYEQGYYDAVSYAVVQTYLPKIEAFMESEAFQWMRTCEKYLREQPFCTLYDGQLVHGTMDVVCLFADRVIVLDYKTDRVLPKASRQALVKRHQGQLEMYRASLRELYPNRRVEAYLYYLEISRLVKVDESDEKLNDC